MTLSISDSAKKRISYLLEDEPADSKLRVSVIGGGCSGFQYHFDFDNNPIAEDDLYLEENGSKVVVDSTSLGFLEESMLDYTKRLGAAAFEITNPNAENNCGCGNSFSM